MLRRFITLLNSPFPDRKSLKGHLQETAYIALFITFFLFAFNPFKFHLLEIGRFWASVCFGLVTFICSVSFDLFMRFVVKVKTDVPSWTLWKWLVVVSLAVAWIAVGNYALLMLLEPHFFRWDVFFSMLINTFLVACMPVLAMGMAVQLQAEKHNQQQALELVRKHGFAIAAQMHSSSAVKTLAIPSDEEKPAADTVEFEVNGSEVLALEPKDIAMVEAMQNYLTVHHRASVNGAQTNETSLVKSVVRCTMANAETLLEDSDVARCHRSYMVNLTFVSDVSGNAQGLKLSLVNMDAAAIPVSRRYIPTIKARLAAINA